MVKSGILHNRIPYLTVDKNIRVQPKYIECVKNYLNVLKMNCTFIFFVQADMLGNTFICFVQCVLKVCLANI